MNIMFLCIVRILAPNANNEHLIEPKKHSEDLPHYVSPPFVPLADCSCGIVPGGPQSSMAT